MNKKKGTEKKIIVLNREDECISRSMETEPVEDKMSLIASFSGKFYGLRTRLKEELSDE